MVTPPDRTGGQLVDAPEVCAGEGQGQIAAEFAPDQMTQVPAPTRHLGHGQPVAATAAIQEIAGPCPLPANAVRPAVRPVDQVIHEPRTSAFAGRQHPVPDAVAREAEIPIATVLSPRQTPRIRVGAQACLGNRQQGPGHIHTVGQPPARGHAQRADRPGPPQEMHEDGLRLVVAMMGQDDDPGAAVPRLRRKQCIAFRPPGLLDPLPALRSQAGAVHSMQAKDLGRGIPGGEGPDQLRIGHRLASQTVVEVTDDQRPSRRARSQSTILSRPPLTPRTTGQPLGGRSSTAAAAKSSGREARAVMGKG